MDPEDKTGNISHDEEVNPSPSMEADWVGLAEEAQNATDIEHSLTVRQALKIYPKALFWSVGVSTAIIMLGYDTALLSTLFAYPSFQQKYGEKFGDGYQIPSRWQAALSNSTTVGVVIGLLSIGWMVDRFGYKRVSLVSYVIMAAFIFIPFFASNIKVLLAGEILCGIPWGLFNILGPAYASEVMPVVLRGYLTSYVNLCWVIGQFISAGVLNGLVNRTDEWGYRLPFAVQWVWPVPLFCIMIFAPESPWWLVRKNRLAEAEHSVKRLAKADANVDIKGAVAMMVHTNNFEKDTESGTTYLGCFKGVDLRRTEICTLVFVIQAASGLLFAQYATYFMEQAGLDASDSFKMNLGYNGLAFLGTVLSWFLIKRFGRRTIYVTGLAILTSVMFVIGFVSLAPSSSKGAMWAQSSLMLIWIFFYDLTVGPLAFTIAAETSSTRLRGKTLAVARAISYSFSIVAQTVNPYMLNPSEGNWKGKTAFFWGGLSLLCFVWGCFRLPECKGRTYEELDILFEKRIPARQFRNYVVDAYSGDQVLVAKDEVAKDEVAKEAKI
jgi:SP family general alpha glucoside:H+ symporter-like MFS transporter